EGSLYRHPLHVFTVLPLLDVFRHRFSILCAFHCCHTQLHALKHAVQQLRLLICLSFGLRDSPAAVARHIMWRFLCAASMAALLSLPSTVLAARQTHQYYSTSDDLLLPRNPFELYQRDKRPEDCPPCFNCNLADMPCLQFGNCTKSSGKCSCPPGFGGEDCSQPLCGALPDGKDRLPRQGNEPCQCKEGWEGINCNVCKTNQACNAMMPTGEDGVCYREGVVQKENFQICDITNKKILDTLKDKKPQATFSCNAERAECNFQFWVDQRESFYCGLDTCSWEAQASENRNTTKYKCENIKCKCVPGRMLCGENGSIDIGDFLEEEIKGPAEFRSTSTDGGSPDDGSAFSEPGMNGLISSVFGDRSIFLKCHSGECLYKNEVPGYQRPIKTINTPLIAGVISGVALFIVAVVLLIFFLNRRFAGRKWGYIHLSEDEEEENARLLADHKPAALLFENISYNLKGKQILTNVTGAVHPGELMAIMGASGAGKTTFLDILARKRKRGLVTGEAWLNGEKVSDDQFQNVIGFVDQDDTMLPTLTVHETILDSALLRLPREMSRAAKEQKVEDVERQLGIYHIKDQIIGSEDSGHGRGISGGEKRRVGIACELVTSPSILFLDEPTSGLDAFNAFNVIECLVTLVKTYNRTVVFTIHQPRSNIVALFDQLILLAHGRTVYSGPFRDCQSYFDSIGYSCPPGFNIADYLVDLTMHASAPIGDDDDLEDQLAEADGRTTRASSTMAIKSIPSISNVSIGESTASAGEPLLRPRGKRKDSIRKQQERQLYSRKPGSIELPSASSVRSDGGESAFERDMEGRDQQWVRLNKQQGQPIPHIAEDPNNLPPAEEGATGTNLDILVSGYRNSEVAQELRNDIHNMVSGTDTIGHTSGMPNGSLGGKVKGYRKPWIHRQFIILSFRTWRNLYRDPMLMLTHYAIAIVLAVFTGFLFYGLTDDLKGFQNRLGFFFFLLALYGFSALTSLTVFAPERLLFLRERAKGYYAPPAYYLAKLVFDIVPLRLIPPIIMGCIVYPMTGLIPSWGEFFKFILFIVLFNLAAAMVMLFIGICVRNQGVANLLGVLVMLFSLLFGGFLLNHETIPRPLLWLQSLSIFHFAFEGLIVNEVRYLSLVDHKYGLDIEVPGSAILSSFGFDVLALWNDAIGLAVFCAVFLVLGYLSIHFLLVERR
ncbi:ABC transporter G family member, partial [Pseudocercospora fuligena]